MTKITREVCSSEVSRRDLFKVAAGAAGAVAIATVAGTQAFADNKMAKTAAQYQTTPHSGQSCAKCQNFVSPSACKLVDGPISPNGWCSLFAAKA